MKDLRDFQGKLQLLYWKFGTPPVRNFEIQDVPRLLIDRVAVHGYVINREKKVLLVRHRMHGRRWLPPGGHPEKEESFEKTAVREIREEVGLLCHVNSFAANIWMRSHISGVRYVLLFFEASIKSGKPMIKDSEGDITDARLFRLTRLPLKNMYEIDKLILSTLGYAVDFSLDKVDLDFQEFRPLILDRHG